MNRSMRGLAAALTGLVGLSLMGSSCEPPRSKNPIGDEKHAAADKRLDGVWIGHGNDETSNSLLTFIPRANGLVDLVLVGSDDTKGAVVLAFQGLAAKAGGKSYLSLRSKSYGDDYAGTVKVADDYIFARYELADGAMTLSLMDETNVEAAVKAGALEGTAPDAKAIALTASSEKLVAFLASPAGEKAFKPFATFHRVKKADFPSGAKKAP